VAGGARRVPAREVLLLELHLEEVALRGGGKEGEVRWRGEGEVGRGGGAEGGGCEALTLLRKRIIEVSLNDWWLQIWSKSVSASSIRLVFASSYSIWSNSEIAVTKITAVTLSKQGIHRGRERRERW